MHFQANKGRHGEVAFLSEFPQLQVLRQDGSLTFASEALKEKDYVLVFFAAYTLPTCQRFTPALADFYAKHRVHHNFEVLFVSTDKERQQMLSFFHNQVSNYNTTPEGAATLRRRKAESIMTPHEPRILSKGDKLSPKPPTEAVFSMHAEGGEAASSSHDANMECGFEMRQYETGTRLPDAAGHGNWIALPFDASSVQRHLMKRFGVNSVPTVVVVDNRTSKVIARGARAMVLQDPEANYFPWHFADEELRTSRKVKSRGTTVLQYIAAIVGLLFILLLGLIRFRHPQFFE